MKQIKKIVLTFCVLSLAFTGFSQINIESLIREQPPSTIEIINRTRTLLLEAFVQDDREKVQEIHHFLSENFDENSFVTLFPFERILLLAWLSDFENMLEHIKKYGYSMARTQRQIRPDVSNNFYEIIVWRVEQDFENILYNLQNSHLTQEQKDFSAIYLRYFFITSQNFDTIVREINTDTRNFIVAHPHSELIEHFENLEHKPHVWGGAFGFGFGYSAKTNQFSEYFMTHNGAFDIYFDVLYRNFVATVGVLMVTGRVREDIILPENLILPEGTTGNVISPYLSFGYRFLDNRRIMITPMVGIGMAFVNPGTVDQRRDNPDLGKVNHSFGLTTHFGIATDIRLDRMTRMRGQNFVDPSFPAVRLSYRFLYNTLFSQPPPHFNGNIHTITLGFHISARGTRPITYI